MSDQVDQELAVMDERAAKNEAVLPDIIERDIAELCRHPALTLDVSATIGDAIAMMQHHHVGAVVITQEGKLAGILTERDLLMKVLGKVDDYRDQSVTELMTARPESLRRGDELVYLMNAMYVGGFRHMPIVDDNDVPQHVVSLRDVLALILDQVADRIRNIPTTPYRGDRKRYSG
ncbi:MAG: CBS domain-containing protein [Deltaproteobacteria bacterium]|nr:CBS domain-containing protein [Deltaproteobacteria bacterium]